MSGSQTCNTNPNSVSDVRMMVCTAGHVDHGKTSLVKLMTGCNTDRLQAELDRGLTIELGFAPFVIDKDLSVGIVDVPGHEKFIKNMVAGVSGIEMTILVVAADDGMMPQTVEHFRIMELLGVHRGIVALTKTDLVSPERVEEVASELRNFLTGTPLEGAKICPVSSKTLDGYGEFYDSLVSEIKTIPLRRRCGIFRMPVERVFLRQGFGLVISGIPVEGTVKVGDVVELRPGNSRGKVRGIQCFMRKTDSGGAGQCLALNIRDLGNTPPDRGQVLCAPGFVQPASIFHLQLSVIPDTTRPLENAEEIKFHSGTIEQIGKVYLMDNKVLGPGETGLASVALREPVAVSQRDRAILRRLSPAFTVAGGRVLAVTPGDRRPRKKDILPRLLDQIEFFEETSVDNSESASLICEYCLRSRMHIGGSVEEISRATLLARDKVAEELSALVETGKLVRIGTDFYVHIEAYGNSVEEIRARVKKFAASDGILSVSLNDMRQELDWPDALWEHLLKQLASEGVFRVEGSRLILGAASKAVSSEEQALIDKIIDLYSRTGFKSPRPDTLPELVGAPLERVDRILEHLCNEKRLVRLSRSVILHADYFRKAQKIVIDTISSDGVLDSSNFKHAIDSTRKYALAILDYLDGERMTVRVGNKRKLAPNYEKTLL
ncbi:selenocysteine-specific translation elongation factor [Candidatus Hydrogenedentota bacterium]